MDVEVEKTEVYTKSRKLKATWDLADLRTLTGKIYAVDEASKEYPYGVDLREVGFETVTNATSWVVVTFDAKTYQLEGQLTDFIWFSQEKHRTAFLIKYS